MSWSRKNGVRERVERCSHGENLAEVGGKVSYEDRKTTWNKGARKVIRRGAAENEVQKHRELMTGAWKKISTQRRRFEVNYDPGLLEHLQEDT